MRFIIALWRFLFRRRSSPENPRPIASQLDALNPPLLSDSAPNSAALGQMGRQVAAMAQIPLAARTVSAQFSLIGEDGSTGVMSESDVVTADGIHAQKTHHLIITASGHVTKATGIKVRCGSCGQFDSTLHRCSEPTCRLPLCELHAIFVELYGQRICYCPIHAMSAENTRNNWKEHWIAQERTRDATNGV